MVRWVVRRVVQRSDRWMVRQVARTRHVQHVVNAAGDPVVAVVVLKTKKRKMKKKKKKKKKRVKKQTSDRKHQPAPHKHGHQVGHISTAHAGWCSTE